MLVYVMNKYENIALYDRTSANYQICIPIPGCNFVQRKCGLFKLHIHRGQIQRENTSNIPR